MIAPRTALLAAIAICLAVYLLAACASAPPQTVRVAWPDRVQTVTVIDSSADPFACSRLGLPDAVACSRWTENTCTVIVPLSGPMLAVSGETVERLWGHEFRHCLARNFH